MGSYFCWSFPTNRLYWYKKSWDCTCKIESLKPWVAARQKRGQVRQWRALRGRHQPWRGAVWLTTGTSSVSASTTGVCSHPSTRRAHPPSCSHPSMPVRPLCTSRHTPLALIPPLFPPANTENQLFFYRSSSELNLQAGGAWSRPADTASPSARPAALGSTSAAAAPGGWPALQPCHYRLELLQEWNRTD